MLTQVEKYLNRQIQFWEAMHKDRIFSPVQAGQVAYRLLVEVEQIHVLVGVAQTSLDFLDRLPKLELVITSLHNIHKTVSKLPADPIID